MKIEDLTGIARELNFEKDWVTINTVLFSDVLNIDDLKIGYLVFNEFLQTLLEELDPIFIAFKAVHSYRPPALPEVCDLKIQAK